MGRAKRLRGGGDKWGGGVERTAVGAIGCGRGRGGGGKLPSVLLSCLSGGFSSDVVGAWRDSCEERIDHILHVVEKGEPDRGCGT